MRGRYGAAVLILAGVIAGCGAGGTTQGSSELFGTWRLTRATGGIFGGERREALTLTIRRDGTAVFASDTQGTRARRFLVARGNGCLGDAVLPILDYDEGEKADQAVVEVTETRLVLADACVSDGFTEEYERIAP
jgi:hypothetical protein